MTTGLTPDHEEVTGFSPWRMSGRLQRLCAVLSLGLPASGAGVSLFSDDGPVGGTVGGTAAAWGPNCREIEQLQLSLGEGPGIHAFTSRRPVLEPDLTGGGMGRWPGFAPAAHDFGVRAVFAIPLQVGATRLGALSIYRRQPGSLSSTAVSHAHAFADLTVRILLEEQGEEQGTPSSSPTGIGDVMRHQAEVHQAQGMVTVDLGVSLSEAMARLRAHAYAEERPLTDVARDVVAGTLVFGRDTPPPRQE